MSRSKQQGVVLIVVLVLLGVLTVMVSSMVVTGSINFKIAGNQQYQTEARLAAQRGIETYISNPANFKIPVPTTQSFVGMDFDGDSVDEYTAVVEPPKCLRSIPIKTIELSVTDPNDTPCYGSGSMQNSGLLSSSGGGSGNSWCSKMMWDVNAKVADTNTSANVDMHQGIYLRALIGTPCPAP